MAFDYKKEYKEFYLPPRKPGIVTVPPMNFDLRIFGSDGFHEWFEAFGI